MFPSLVFYVRRRILPHSNIEIHTKYSLSGHHTCSQKLDVAVLLHRFLQFWWLTWPLMWNEASSVQSTCLRKSSSVLFNLKFAHLVLFTGSVPWFHFSVEFCSHISRHLCNIVWIKSLGTLSCKLWYAVDFIELCIHNTLVHSTSSSEVQVVNCNEWYISVYAAHTQCPYAVIIIWSMWSSWWFGFIILSVSLNWVYQ
jgi:hypothetical protein